MGSGRTTPCPFGLSEGRTPPCPFGLSEARSGLQPVPRWDPNTRLADSLEVNTHIRITGSEAILTLLLA